MSIVTIVPNAGYANGNWGGAGPPFYPLINDSDDSTFILLASGGGPSYYLANWDHSLVTIGSVISSVQVTVRARKGAGSQSPTCFAVPAIQIGGAQYSGGGVTLTTSWQDGSNTWSVNPYTGVSWVYADLAALYLGILGDPYTGTGYEVDCAQIAMYITRTDPAGSNEYLDAIWF